MQVTRQQGIDLFKALNYNATDAWTPDRLASKLNALPKLIDAEKKKALKTKNKELAVLLGKLVSTVEAGDPVTLAPEGKVPAMAKSKKPPVEEEDEIDEETEEDEDGDDEDEGDDDDGDESEDDDEDGGDEDDESDESEGEEEGDEEDEEDEEDADEDEGDDEVALEPGSRVSHPKHGDCTVKLIKDDTCTLMKDNGKVVKGVPVDECEVAEDEDEEEEEEPTESFAVGDTCTHAKHGECTIVKISADEESCTLKKENGKIVKDVSFEDIEPVEDEEDADEEESEEDEDADEEESEEDEDTDESEDEDDEDTTDDEDNMADEDEGIATKTPPKKAAAKKPAAKTPTPKAPPGKANQGNKTAAAKPGAKPTAFKSAGGDGKPGVIASIAEIVSAATAEKPVTKADIMAKLVKRFPERTEEAMKQTLGIQLPTRLRSEKGLNVQKNEKGYYVAKGPVKGKPGKSEVMATATPPKKKSAKK